MKTLFWALALFFTFTFSYGQKCDEGSVNGVYYTGTYTGEIDGSNFTLYIDKGTCDYIWGRTKWGNEPETKFEGDIYLSREGVTLQIKEKSQNANRGVFTLFDDWSEDNKRLLNLWGSWENNGKDKTRRVYLDKQEQDSSETGNN